MICCCDFEGHVLSEQREHLIVEAGRLAVLDEFERPEIVFGRDDHVAAGLDLVERGGLRAGPLRATQPNIAQTAKPAALPTFTSRRIGMVSPS